MKENEALVSAYQLTGIVIHGRGIGKLVGIPTANLEVDTDQELPKTGVYMARVLLDGKIYYGVTHVGLRPTVDNDKNITVETHILNFNQDLYGRKMEIQLFLRIRAPEKFSDLTALLEQIRKDCLSAREYWGIKQAVSHLSIDITTHQIKLDEQEVYLSAKEFDLLYLLYSNPDAAFTKKQIYEAVWHEPANNSYHAVENTVFQIRKRLRAHGAAHNYIKTVIGYGYKFNA